MADLPDAPHSLTPVVHKRIPAMDTGESDAAVQKLIPQLGDVVRVTVDNVSFMERKPHHNVVVASSVNGQIGRVIGQEVKGDTLFLRIETPTTNQLVPVDCCIPEVSFQQDSKMHEPRTSPEKMRKPKDGSYNLT